MIPRYMDEKIGSIWDEENKLWLWQKTELAVLQAQAEMGEISEAVWQKIALELATAEINLDWWRKRDKQIGHDLMAFVDERRRHLPPDLSRYFHDSLTSYDTEEPAFCIMLKQSADYVCVLGRVLEETLCSMALKYRHTVMLGRTHGQEAELQTFGKRCLTWSVGIAHSLNNLRNCTENLKYAKISGALGNYGSINPEVESRALYILGLRPLYGVTQIMPRGIYAALASALCQLVQALDKIATDIRLGARSGNPIYQEPFGKKQKGSSRMPHKKNTISTEQIEGMARMALGFSLMISLNMKTWEERAIEQSSVERVAWPDLFHVTVHSLKVMKRVLSELVVYPDNMLLEIVNARGVYASGEAKAFLAKNGFSPEDAYRIVQLASFNAFRSSYVDEILRNDLAMSFDEALSKLERLKASSEMGMASYRSICEIISNGMLELSIELDVSGKQVIAWNLALKKLFKSPENLKSFNELFSVSYLLRHEPKLFKKILSVD